MTLFHQQLFVIDVCFETQPQTHILCCPWEKVVDHWISSMHFAFWKAKTNQSFFVVDNSFFFQFSLTNLVTHGKFHVDDKNYWWEKVVNYILPRLSTALHRVTIAERNFHPSGAFWTTGGMGPGDFRQLKKRMPSTFQAADLATTVPLTCLQNYVASKANHCFKCFGKKVSFCCIGFIKSKCRPIEWN